MADEKEFGFTANLLQVIPEDTLMVEYRSAGDLHWFVTSLDKTGHVFIVHPPTKRIAFSKAALQDIERLV